MSALTGLPAARTIVSAALTDPAGGSWVYRADGGPIGAIDPYALPLAVRRGGDATRADLAFAPIRDEAGSDLSLRLVLDDGTILVTRFAGGFSDPGLRTPGIAPTSVVARPGDDLNDLAGRYGTVWLTSGTYLLDRPLVLEQPRLDPRPARGDPALLAGPGRPDLVDGDQDPLRPHHPRRVRRPVRRPDPMDRRGELRGRRDRDDRQLRHRRQPAQGGHRPDASRPRVAPRVGRPGRKPRA